MNSNGSIINHEAGTKETCIGQSGTSKRITKQSCEFGIPYRYMWTILCDCINALSKRSERKIYELSLFN